MDRRALTMAVAVAALVSAEAATAHADIFLMKGGGRLTGDVVEESKDDNGTKWVHIRTGFGNVRLQKKLIKKTVRTKRDKNVIRLTEIVAVSLEGDVRVSRDKGETWLPLRLFPPKDATVADAQIPPRLGPGDRVKTADDGRGEFDVGFGVVHLESNGEVAFNATGASMAVLRGKTGVRVDESVPKKEFRVETPQASMGVRGTTFLVDVDDVATEVIVDAGEVVVERMRVKAGTSVRVVAEASPERGDPDADADARFERLRSAFAFPRLEWIAVLGGTFAMGTDTGRPPPRGAGVATPVQQLDIPGFLMTRTELTIADFRSARNWARRVGFENVVRTPVPSGQRPMKDIKERVDPPTADDEPARIPWFDARAVAAAYGARLQSEAEWEYAHYAGATTHFYWGTNTSEEMLEYEWLAANSGVRVMTYQESMQLPLATLRTLGCHSHPVGTRRPNAWGLHDILSNAPEWCEDTALPDLNGQPKDGSPRTNGDPSVRSLRGNDVITANPLDPHTRHSDATSKPYGVRLVRRMAQE